MGRKCFDCRGFPAGVKCSIVLSADTEDELIEAVVQHNIAVHGDKDTADFRQMIRNEIKEC
jgi:predicted small metal-binding protein